MMPSLYNQFMIYGKLFTSITVPFEVRMYILQSYQFLPDLRSHENIVDRGRDCIAIHRDRCRKNDGKKTSRITRK